MPAMLDGKGHVVMPDYVQVYYKREPDSSPSCDPNSSTYKGICVGIPNGLRFISGFQMSTMTQGPKVGEFHCGSNVWKADVHGMTKANNTTCPVGTKLEMLIQSSTCWNGQLDSPDHMSHVVSLIRNTATGAYKCPSGYPYYMPQFTIGAFFTVGAGDDASLWSLSSDMPGMPKGSTLHFDYFEAWDTLVKDMWVSNCVGKKLNCSGGALGNGKALRGASQPKYGWNISSRLVPISPRAAP
jgi:hypothetical protein